MRHLTGQDQFLLEAAENLGLIRQFGTNHLQGNHTVHFTVPGLVDRAHAALAQGTDDFVAPAQDHSGT